MNPEDRLRELLRAEAATLVPAGDGLARIRDRVARRRRARFWLLPSTALATAGAAAAFFLFAHDDPSHKQTLQPASPSATAEPTTEPTAAPTAVPADDGGMPLDQAAIWPFTSQAQASAWVGDHGTLPWAENGLDVGRHFVTDFLKLTGVDVSQPCVSCGVLSLKVDGKEIGTVAMVRVGAGFATGHGTQVYTVVNVSGTDLTITTPKSGAALTSPTQVSGRITGADENVQLRLISSTSTQLATAGAPAGSAVPWQATLSWTNNDWTGGGLVGITYDGRGILNRVTAIPVTRGTAAPASSFAALVDGHVSLYDAATGARVKQLTYPPAGKTDSDARWSSGTLLWIRSATTGCSSELNRLEAGTASTVTKSSSLRYGSAALSPSGGWVAWTEIPCSGSDPGEVVVSGGGAPARRLAVPSGSTAEVLDVGDDGAVLVLTNDAAASGPGTIGLVSGGALTLDGIKPLHAASGCTLSSGAAFDGANPVAFETCLTDVRLVRFSSTAARVSADAAQKAKPPTSVSVRDGEVLVWLFGSATDWPVATYADGRFTTVVPNSGCSTDAKGCVLSPDW